MEHDDGSHRAVQGDEVVLRRVKVPGGCIHAPCLPRLRAALAVKLGPRVGAPHHLVSVSAQGARGAREVTSVSLMCDWASLAFPQQRRVIVAFITMSETAKTD